MSYVYHWKQELSSFWRGRLFGHNRHGLKSGGPLCPFLRGGTGPYLTQCLLGQGLPPYQVASWSIQPFGHNWLGRKVGAAICPFPWRSWSLSKTMWLGRGLPAYQVVSWSIQRLATINLCYRQTGQTTVP